MSKRSLFAGLHNGVGKASAMSAEYLTAVASIGTFVVIAVTAIAAVVQLRHIRSANQLTGVIHIRERFAAEGMQEAIRFTYDELPTRLQDSQYRAELMRPDPDRRKHPELRVSDFFEQVGSDVKYHMVAADSILDFAGSVIANMWDQLEEVVALRRCTPNGIAMYENFEYLAVLAQDFHRKHALGNYPAGVRRLPLASYEASESAGPQPAQRRAGPSESVRI